ncbi:IucA/IucC family protein [Jeotgalibacillus haloalkalitolerans]|uniref:IucA/IucC family protein n=1 Tax=Jeotgalibacillus haloalkalitolerans TaxID=3104292 RepID=A0ABU5KHK7_9BACL|nr:IucA/IucC family protein [Jeotgalibacillus sp. HH7-29]MDZ5710724.1 IucA/IucC family protein [Jeotgalibacillus sp. HH7-29]
MQMYQSVSDPHTHRVTRQLVEALLFESLIPFQEVRSDEPAESCFVMHGRHRNYECRGKRSAFNRVRLTGPVVYKENNRTIQATLEDLLQDFIPEEKAGALRTEWMQTIALSRWNDQYAVPSLSRRELTFEALESQLIEGHPYHPSYKARTGFTIEDHEKYGPEAGQTFQVIWTAVCREITSVCITVDESEFWQRELGTEGWQAILQEMKRQNLDLTHYTLLPVHPWQWEALQDELGSLLAEKLMIRLDVESEYYTATQSVRTLINQRDYKKAHLKLPMNMVNTSSLRTLNPESVCAAPAISAWIDRAVRADAFLKDRMIVLKEYAGVMAEAGSAALTGQLGAIWRESLSAYLSEGDEAVPFTAMCVTERDGELFIQPWLDQYGIEAWIQRLIEVAVIPVWHLLVAHGIGLEAHAQNMVLVHQNGWPQRIVLRDFHESVEYTEAFVNDLHAVPDFEKIHPGFKGAPDDQFYRMANVEALRELVMDTLFIFNLADLSYVLEQQTGFEEERFWRQVNVRIAEHISSFPHLQKRHAALGMEQPVIYTESLLKKKLISGEHRHLVPNEFERKEASACSI